MPKILRNGGSCISIPGEQFFKMSNAIFCHGLTPIQLAVYSCLVSCAGQKEKCWPSVRTIAACCGCSKNAARDAVSVLAERGFISRTKRRQEYANGRNRQTSNLYFILPMPPLAVRHGQKVRHPTLANAHM